MLGLREMNIYYLLKETVCNDFTGLVPSWDDNMVYSPHKYWSPVDEEYLDWLIQDTLTTPIFVGETGENSIYGTEMLLNYTRIIK